MLERVGLVMLGVLFPPGLFVVLADRYFGRRWALLWACIVAVKLIGQSVAPP